MGSIRVLCVVLRRKLFQHFSADARSCSGITNRLRRDVFFVAGDFIKGTEKQQRYKQMQIIVNSIKCVKKATFYFALRKNKLSMKINCSNSLKLNLEEKINNCKIYLKFRQLIRRVLFPTIDTTFSLFSYIGLEYSNIFSEYHFGIKQPLFPGFSMPFTCTHIKKPVDLMNQTNIRSLTETITLIPHQKKFNASSLLYYI